MAELIRIGNSKGVRIPKVLIEQAGLDGVELDLEVVSRGLLLKPSREARQGWREQIEAAVKRGEVDYDHDWLES